MLHRLKLRLLYGALLRADGAARRKKMRVILVSGFLVYLPFLALAYFVSFETRRLYLVVIGLLSACTCIPVVFYAYAKGFNRPLRVLFSERREELSWLALKIGFLYPLMLYFMILGIVEFLLGYNVVRAAMISFVAAAVARDGFEIGFIRARSENKTISTFPDGEALFPFLKSASFLAGVLLTFLIAGSIGFFVGHIIENPRYQTLAAGLFGGGIMILSTMGKGFGGTSLQARLRLFMWPGFTMAATYFLTLAYLMRIIFEIRASPFVDLALLIGSSSAWLNAEILALAHRAGKSNSIPLTLPLRAQT